MYGFIVTSHFNNYDIINKCLNLLFNNIPDNSYVLLYINETTCKKVLNIKQEYLENEKIKSLVNNFEVFYIENQELNNGLTGTWNLGINHFLKLKETNKFDCKVITILGHDTFINKDIKYLLEPALESENNKELKYYGPLYKNFKGKNDELWQDEFHHHKYTRKFIIGSLFTFPLNSLIKNKLGTEYYFNEIKYPFGYNDIDWYNRFIKIGGSPIIIKNCIIDHQYQRTWIKYDRNLNKDNSIKNGEDIESIFNFYEYKTKELGFNWMSYLTKNPDLKNKGIITNPKQALDHYLTKGIHQRRKY
jgi:hypothetical protein